MGATQRLFHLARAFHVLGHDAGLLAARSMANPDQAALDRAFPGTVIRTAHSGDYPAWLDRGETARRLVRLGWRARGNTLYWARVSWGWARRLDISHVQRTLMAQGQYPALVWGVSAGLLEGAVGARRVARALGVPYVLELQDPPRGAGLDADNPRIQAELQCQLVAADAVVVTTASYRQHLLQQYGLPPERVHAVHLSYDASAESEPAPWAAANAAEPVFRLGYAGSLYAGQSLLPLIKAWARVLAANPGMQQQSRLELAGGGAGMRAAREAARTLGVTSWVHYWGALPGASVAGFLRGLNVSLVVLERQRVWQVPGKVYECMAAQRPILGIMPRDCEAARILRDSGLGLVCDPDDGEGIARSLEDLWQQWSRGRLEVRPVPDFIQQFDAAYLPSKLKRVLWNIPGLTWARAEGTV